MWCLCRTITWAAMLFSAVENRMNAVERQVLVSEVILIIFFGSKKSALLQLTARPGTLVCSFIQCNAFSSYVCTHNIPQAAHSGHFFANSNPIQAISVGYWTGYKCY